MQSCPGANGSPSAGQVVGTLLGAAAGGLVGSQVGGGMGNKIAIGAGVLGGGLLGNKLGDAMGCDEQQQHNQAAQNAFERQPSGQPAAWTNPDSGARGSITPLRAFQREDGTNCREFRQQIIIEGRPQRADGVACRQPDGTWAVSGQTAQRNNAGYADDEYDEPPPKKKRRRSQQ